MASPQEIAPALVAEVPSLRIRVRALYELGKPNLTALVVLTAVLGFYLATPIDQPLDGWRLLALVLGTGLTSMGACALNMFIEHAIDARMVRTRSRPLPSGRVTPDQAVAFALLSFTFGFVGLVSYCGPLPALLSLITALTYAFWYTPAKQKGPLAIWIGAIPGAIPPVMGWAAVRGDLGLGGLSLFLILFCWQFPHFIALAYMYQDDYGRAGFRFLPQVDPQGRKAARQIALGSAALLLASLGPWVLGLAGTLYGVGVLVAGLGFVWASIGVLRKMNIKAARRMFFVSIAYYPLLLVLLWIDRLLS